MKNLFCLLALFWFSSVSVFAQNLCESAEANPLDCVLYLLKTENNFDDREDELMKLSVDYWFANDKEKALQTLELIDDEDKEKKVELYLAFAEDSLEKGGKAEASKLLLDSLRYIDKNEFDIGFLVLKKIAFNLALTGNESGAKQLIDSIEEKYFKAEFMVAAADAFQQRGKVANALSLLPIALEYAETSDSEKQRYSAVAAVAKKYAELGKKVESLDLISRVEIFAFDDEEQFEAVFQTYLQLKLYDRASELVKDNKSFSDSESALKYAEINEKAGDKEKAIKYLQKASLYENESFDNNKKIYNNEFLVNVVKFHLKLDREDLAFQIAKRIKNIKPQHFSLLEIAKYNQKKKNLEAATYYLNFDFVRISKAGDLQFDYNEFTKAGYLSDVADLAVEIKKFDLAAKIVDASPIPFHRAGGQAITVLKQKGTITRAQALKTLESANVLMKSDGEKLADYSKDRFWSTLAFDYAEIGETEKSLEIFSEILNHAIVDERMSSRDKINSLIMVGTWFKKANLKTNEDFLKSLQNFVEKWSEENEPQD